MEEISKLADMKYTITEREIFEIVIHLESNF